MRILSALPIRASVADIAWVLSSCDREPGAASGRPRRVRRDARRGDQSTQNAPTSGLEATFGCIDTRQNVELCGRCVGAGGVDCINIPGATE